MKNMRLYLILAFILFSSLTLYITSMLTQSKKEGILQKRLEIFESQHQSVYNSYAKLSELFYHEAIDDSNALEIFAKASQTTDKDELQQIRTDLFNELKHAYAQLQRYNLRQLHFHLPNNDSFLRFHKPERYGDNLTDIRTTVRLANETKKRISGFEEGRIYNGFRYVFPLSYQNRHIGTMEASLSFLAMKQDIEENLRGYVQFMVKKSIVDQKVFDSQKPFYILSDLNPS